jgi:hypothetical protein
MDLLYSPTKGYIFPKSGQKLIFPEQRGAFHKLAELLWESELFVGDMNDPLNIKNDPRPSWDDEKGEWRV